MKYKIFKYTGNIETFIPKTSTIVIYYIVDLKTGVLNLQG